MIKGQKKERRTDANRNGDVHETSLVDQFTFLAIERVVTKRTTIGFLFPAPALEANGGFL